MADPNRVVVQWSSLTRRDPRWHAGLCLYAYVHPSNKRLLYLGKADLQSVQRRLYGSHKDAVFDEIWDLYALEPHELEVLQGELMLEEGRRRSSQLLSDVESLLIIRLKPRCNIASTRSRIYRPGLRVDCVGDWPHRRWRFRDWD